MNLYAQGVHPAGLVYEIGSRLGYDSRSMQFSLNKMNNEIISALQKSGDLTPQEYDQIVSNVMEKNLLQIKRNSPSLGRNVSLFEEIQQLGFTRNTSNRGMAPGSLRQIGFDGQRIPQPFISTGGGIPAQMATSHWNRMQELFPTTSRKQPPQFGIGRTMSSIFGAQRGHVGASSIIRELSKIRLRNSGGIIGMNQGGVVPGTNIRGYGFGGRVGQIAGFAAPLIAPAIGEKIG